jgi:hypothetical protein
MLMSDLDAIHPIPCSSSCVSCLPPLFTVTALHFPLPHSQRSFLGLLLSGQDLTTGTRLTEEEVVAQVGRKCRTC